MGEAWVDVEFGQVLAETNNGSGDCLFLAISQQLDAQLSPLQLRQMAVEYLSEHRGEMEAELLSLGWEMMDTGDIPIPLEDPELLIDATIQTLTNPHVCAECIAALSLRLSREIRVYQERGPTIVFPQGENAGLRILMRFPHGGAAKGAARRTHYESVLSWRPMRPAPLTQPSSTQDAQCQTAEVSVQQHHPEVSVQQNHQEQRRQSGSTMVLRSRPGDQGNNLRPEPNSDEEFDDDNAPDARYRRVLKLPVRFNLTVAK
ncbi:OTU domain-containing protein 4 [Frankliniella fusca]|uniref:OTU domain-containing protein 4 n=1 Tax=Frankliniella fusca TaxID=407009 RepID=A0AAE1LHR3_9NEOP|nr:OTU domain-containing protein 4 [Frankliniella fusca]